MFRVAVMVGSVRPTSSNLQFARALEKLAAGRLQFDFVDIASLPHYDDALWDNPPESVIRLKDQIAAADGVLLVTPEFNRSIPGVLKNALDWPSRPFGQSVWEGKPAAIVGATAGQTGTAAAQVHLRSIASVLGLIVMGRPEVYQTLKPGMIAEDGTITDDRTRLFLGKWVDAFVAFLDRLATPAAARVAAE